MSNSKWGNLSGYQREAFERQISVSGTGTAGAFLTNNLIDSVIQHLSVREYGLLSAMPRRPGSGSQFKGATRAPNATLAEWKADYSGATLQESSELNGTYAQRTFDYKTLLSGGAVSRFLQATGASYADILAAEIMGMMDDFTGALENGLVNGDTTSTPAECDGFLQIILDDVSTFAQETQMSSSSSTTALSLAKLDEMIDSVKGSSNRSDLVLVMSKKQSRNLNALVDGFLQIGSVQEFAGNRVRTYDGIPIVVSSGMLDTGTLSGGGAMTATGGGGAGAIMCLNKRYCWIEELTPMTVMPLARQSSQVEEFDIFWDGAPVIANPYGAAVLSGLS